MNKNNNADYVLSLEIRIERLENVLLDLANTSCDDTIDGNKIISAFQKNGFKLKQGKGFSWSEF